jgi:DNA-binding MarR family transcriptional regulator
MSDAAGPPQRPVGRSGRASVGRALTELEFDSWRVFVASSRLLVGELDRKLRREADIPHSWFILLVVLSERPERTARQSDLASVTDFSLSRLSHAINRMGDRGWVVRRTDPNDRRAADVTLTDAGLAALIDITRGHDVALRELFFDRLSAAEVEALRGACRALLPGLDGASETLAAGPPTVKSPIRPGAD